MEVECALLDGEQDSEMAQLQRDKELLEELKGKLHKIEKTSNPESGVKSGSQFLSDAANNQRLTPLMCPLIIIVCLNGGHSVETHSYLGAAVIVSLIEDWEFHFNSVCQSTNEQSIIHHLEVHE